MKKFILATVVAISLVSCAQAQGILTYFAVGPESQEPGYSPFLYDMVSAMRGMPSPVAFVPSNGNIPISQIISYDNLTGHKVFAGAGVVSPSLFTAPQIIRSFSSTFFGFTNAVTGMNFGPMAIGVRWGPGGPNTGDTIYTSGGIDGVMVNELYVIANSYTVRAGSPADDAAVTSMFKTLYGSSVPLTVAYSYGNMSVSKTVNLYVPEPATSTLLIIGGIGISILRKRR